MRFQIITLLFAVFTAFTVAQQAFPQTPEVHPKLQTKQCKKSATGGAPVCTSLSTSIVFDANSRDLLLSGSKTSCLNATSGTFNTTICTDAATCAARCGWNGIDYSASGIHTNETDNSITLNLLTPNPTTNKTYTGPRVYLLSQNESAYQMFQLKNQEFTYEVDVSNLPCGSNGALYFVAMPEDGGASLGNNTAGAAFGTGYCDAQCEANDKFVNGLANFVNKTTGSASIGNCCSEMDIWEANSISTAYTPHACTGPAQSTCLNGGTECGSMGICDKSGCAFNHYRMGNKTYYGPGSNFTVDTTKPFTVVTQFITNDNTSNGTLTEIRRQYIQNNRTISNSEAVIAGIDKGLTSITDHFCEQQSTAFNDTNGLAFRGGMQEFGTNLDYGMVLSMSMWDTDGDAMNWLDSAYADGLGNASQIEKPGVLRGSCDPTVGFASLLEKEFPDTRVKFSNLRWGDIGSTL